MCCCHQFSRGLCGTDVSLRPCPTHVLVRDPIPYLGRNTDPELIRRTGFDGRNKELRAVAARWARIQGARRATDAEWADRGRLGAAMRTAPSAGIAMVDVAS